MKKIVVGLALSGGLFGLWYFTRQSPAERLKATIADKVVKEGQRVDRSVDRNHIMLALERFDQRQLELFDTYLNMWISRDWGGMQQLLPRWQSTMLPVIRESPEWKRYAGIIFGS